jgi:hypothetical protein
MKRHIVPVLILSAALSACSREEAAPEQAAAPVEAAKSEPASQAPAGADAKAARSHSLSPNAQAQRKLIQTAELHLEVSSYEEARRTLDRELARVGGFVADARIEHHDGEVSRAELTLRIPSKELASFLSDAAGYGKVMHEALHSEDVTDSYADIDARLNNARRLEARLLELMASKTDGVQQLLEVEREIARVREQIELFESQLKRYDEQVALSTVKMQIATHRVYAAAPAPTLGERIGNTLGQSWGSMTALGRGILLFLVALVPWLVPMLLVVWGLRTLVRRMKAISRQRSAVSPPPAISNQPSAISS